MGTHHGGRSLVNAKGVPVTDAERDRLITFLRNKMCGPCRREKPDPEHEGCAEAAILIEIVEKDA